MSLIAAPLVTSFKTQLAGYFLMLSSSAKPAQPGIFALVQQHLACHVLERASLHLDLVQLARVLLWYSWSQWSPSQCQWRISTLRKNVDLSLRLHLLARFQLITSQLQALARLIEGLRCPFRCSRNEISRTTLSRSMTLRFTCSR
jgi:hypothetical protein